MTGKRTKSPNDFSKDDETPDPWSTRARDLTIGVTRNVQTVKER